MISGSIRTSWGISSRSPRRPAAIRSPRAELDLLQLARARAMLDGRDFVIPDDVKALAIAALAHRISLRPETDPVRRVRGADVIGEVLHRVPVPRTPA